MKDAYLKKRGLRYYVRVSVPKDAQYVVGKPEIVRSLKTRDKEYANKIKFEKIAEIHKDIDAAVAEAEERGKGDPSLVSWLEKHLVAELEHYTAGRTDLDSYSYTSSS